MNAGRSRLRFGDLLGLGVHGLRAHPTRALLSGLGIAIGIAAMVAVLGIASSSQALVNQQLSALGTNLLTASGGKDLIGQETPLPAEAPDRVRALPGVQTASWTASLEGVNAFRNERVNRNETNSIRVSVADGELPRTVGAKLAAGEWLNDATNSLPVVVLGAKTAGYLGVTEPGELVELGGTLFQVAGILQPVPLAPELDTQALIGAGIAEAEFGFDGSPTTVYERSDDERVVEVRGLLPAALNPESPSGVEVSRPSEALAAQNAVDQAFTGLLVGVGSIALLVGGIGVANTMVITVLERRKEIGLRRALGATKPHIRRQFLVEAMMLAANGGLAGALIGWAVTAAVAMGNGWPVTLPAVVLVASIVVTVAVGAIAGVLPAVRASNTPPTVALNS